MADETRQKEARSVRIETERASLVSGQTLELAPGSKIMLETGSPQLRFWGEFLGAKRGEYLILSLPGRTDIRDALVPDQPLTARCLHRDYNICGFQTSVASVVRSPHPLLFLNYPARIEVLNLRHDLRAACFLKSSVFIESVEYQAFMINLSASGARFALEAWPDSPLKKLRSGMEAFCLFKMTGSEDDLYIRGEIKGVAEKESLIEFGFCFVEIDPVALSRIKDYVQLVSRFFNSGAA